MDSREMKKSKKREKLLMKQLQQEKINEKCSEWEELNMSQELHPISHYINDREEMIKQMFNVISERQLMKMLPPALKGMSIEELQADCLIQLVGMSKKRILAILEGREFDSSSESPSESDLDGTAMEEQSEPETIVKISKHRKIKKPRKRNSSTPLEDIQKPAAPNSKKVKTKHKAKKVESIEVPESDESSDGNDEVAIDIDATIKEADVLPAEENVENKGKTLLEILELEMRAKAIRALLERENQPEEEKQSKDESTKNTESDKSEKTNVDQLISEKKSELNLSSSVVTKDSEDTITSKEDEKNSKIDLTCDDEDDPPPKEKETSTKSTDVNVEKKSSLNTQPTSSTEIFCEKISSTVEKSSTSPEKSNWAQRWLDSNKVKKVVSTSKMCTNIRRKIKKSLIMKSRQAEDSQLVEEEKPNIPVQEFSGSTQEYELLKKLIKKKQNTESIIQDNSETNLQENNETNLQENMKPLSPTNSEANLQENIESESQENIHVKSQGVVEQPKISESNLQDNSEPSLHENDESDSSKNSDSNLPKNVETNLPENSDSIVHKDIAHENSESNSDKDIVITDIHKSSELLEKFDSNSHDNSELSEHENIESNLNENIGTNTHLIIEVNSDDSSSNKFASDDSDSKNDTIDTKS